MAWINSYVIIGIQTIFNFVGKKVIQWPILSICCSVTFVMIFAIIGIPNLDAKTTTEDFGASAEPGYAAYLVLNKYFPTIEYLGTIQVEVKPGYNMLDATILNKLCKHQRRMEADPLYQNACVKDISDTRCALNMFDLIRERMDSYANYGDGLKPCDMTPFQVTALKLCCSKALEQAFGYLTNIKYDLNESILPSSSTSDDESNEGLVDFARTLNLPFKVRGSKALGNSEDYLKKWEEKFLIEGAKLAANPEKYLGPEIKSVTYLAPRSFGDEANNVIMRDTPLLGASFILMFIYCYLTLVRKWERPLLVQTRGTLAMCMILTACLALAFAYGVQGIVGFSFSALSLSAAFIIFGVGIDDTIVLMDAYARVTMESPRKPEEEGSDEYIKRTLLEAFTEVGDAITLTTVTDCLAFFIGTATDVKALSDFSLTAGLAVIMVFILQGTFYLPCVLLDEQRRLRERYDILCCIKTSNPHSKRPRKDKDSMSQQSVGAIVNESIKNFTAPDKFNIMKPIFTVPMSSLVCIVFIVLGIFCSLYAPLVMHLGFDQLQFFADDSYVLDFLITYQTSQGGGVSNKPTYMFEDIDFSNSSQRKEIINVYETQIDLQNKGVGIIKVVPDSLDEGCMRFLWTEYGHEFKRTPMRPRKPKKGGPTPLLDWLEEPGNSKYKSSFNFDRSLMEAEHDNQLKGAAEVDGKKEASSKLRAQKEKTRKERRTYQRKKKRKNRNYAVAAKFILVVLQPEGFPKLAKNRKTMYDEAQKWGNKYVKLSIYEVLYSSYDRFNKTMDYVITMVITSIIGVFIINCFFTLPLYSFVATICVTFVISEILMVFPLSDIPFNVMAVVNLTMAIGFAVDYCSHIGQAFAGHPELPPCERALMALNTMATSVMKAGFSTVLSVIMLVFSFGAVLQTLLKCFLVMVISGLLHAIVFLPCMLFLIATFSEAYFPGLESKDTISIASHQTHQENINEATTSADGEGGGLDDAKSTHAHLSRPQPVQIGKKPEAPTMSTISDVAAEGG